MGADKEAIKLAIRDEILGEFRTLAKKGEDILPTAWLYGNFLPSLKTKEEAAMEETVAEMIHEGIVEQVRGAKPTYRLTQKGRELLCL